MFKRILLSLICLTLTAALAQDKPAKRAEVALPSEETVNSFMHNYFGFDPSATWKISKIQASNYGLAEVSVTLAQHDQPPSGIRLLIAPDGAHAIVGNIIPFGAKPFAATRSLLKADAKGPAKGPANATVTIVEFSDLQCPHCKDAQPAIEKILAAHPEVKFVFQNFPLSGHDWARKAASYADCVAHSPTPDAFWKFVDDVFAAQSQITASNADDKLTEIADSAGVKGSEIATCAAAPATDGHVQKSIDLGAAAEVGSTPTFFINGRNAGNITGAKEEDVNAILVFHAKEDQ